MLIIKEIAASDRQGVDNIAHALHPQWFTESALVEIANAVQTQNGRVAVGDGRLVGFATYLLHNDGNAAELAWIGVHPDFHRKGIGRRLVIAIEGELKRKGFERLEVHTVATTVEYEPYARTRRFYHSLGFSDVIVKHNWFPTGDDGLLLAKQLGKQ
jgi:GNAT superfamily N-acetyltransferase